MSNQQLDDWQYNNEEEAEMGQLQAIHNNMNHIAKVRRQLELEAAQPSLTHCEDCGDEIPEQRRLVVAGCRLCVYCKQLSERN